MESRILNIVCVMGALAMALGGVTACGKISSVDTGTGTTTSTGTATNPIVGPTVTPLPTGTGAGNGTPTSGSGTYFSVNLVPSTSYTYKIHNSTDTTTFTTPCQIAMGATNPSNDQMCIIEGMELDQYTHGVSFSYNLPPGMCSYYSWMPYYYYAFQPGDGSAVIHIDIDKNGDVGTDPGNTGVDTGPVTSSNAAVTVSGSTPVCAYDYSPQGPNCCTGDYTVITRTWSTTGTNPGYTTVTSSGSFGGNQASCLSGPAVASQPKSPSGFPIATLQEVIGTGIANAYTVAAPIALEKHSDVYLANYFSGGIAPTPVVQPYYELQCLDPAQELVARLRIMVRKWDTAAEFAKNGAGNPNLAGNEPPPFGTFPNDDFEAWSEFANTYPGASE
jgi:hypothetical protein